VAALKSTASEQGARLLEQERQLTLACHAPPSTRWESPQRPWLSMIRWRWTSGSGRMLPLYW